MPPDLIIVANAYQAVYQIFYKLPLPNDNYQNLLLGYEELEIFRAHQANNIHQSLRNLDLLVST